MSNLSTAPKVSVAEFEAIFESVRNWGRWGDDDVMGTLNLITPEHVKRACATVTEGRTVSMAIPINTVAGPDNPSPAIHHMTQMHDLDIGSGSLHFAMDFLGMECHGDCHTHIDALCHIAYAASSTTASRDGGHQPRTRRAVHGRTTPRASSAAASCWTFPAIAASPGWSRARPSPGPSSRPWKRLRACAWRKAICSCFAPATTAAGWSSAGGTTARATARARPACTSTPSPGCTSEASPGSCPTATGRLCPAWSTASFTRSTRCRSRRWA